MHILDNSVLSAFVRLKLLEKLQALVSEAIISQEIFLEYSRMWQQAIPEWITITKPTTQPLAAEPPLSLSLADLSTILLALEYELPLASDDQELRNFAKELSIKVTGSLGLLKAMYQRKIITTKKEYLKYLDSLKKDDFFSEELYHWVLDI